MTIKEKAERDLAKAIKDGQLKLSSKNDRQSFIQERTNYYTALEKMDRGDKLAVLLLLNQLTHGPLGVIDFLFFHPIKTIIAFFQLFIIVIVFYIVYQIVVLLF